MPDEPTLAQLAADSGLLPRSIRSWVTQGLLPGPLTRGPAARYPSDTLERLLAIRAMRDQLHMPLIAIRQELLVASPEAVRALAAKATSLAPEATEESPSAPSSALDYIRGLRTSTANALCETAVSLPQLPPPPKGFEALELTLRRDRTAPTRKARAEEWLRIAVTPDVELAARGPLDAETRARLERCAALIRDILLGRDR
jgi:DNA-binding transcriptional MerR regulator